MEKRITRKIDTFQRTFKEDIKNKMVELNLSNTSLETYNELLQYIYDYNSIEITKDDFKKRKRVKNTIPQCDRCCALRANHEQCTRRKKSGEKFCGTHIKGTPHGEVDKNKQIKNNSIKIEVWAQDIKGIIYFIDKSCNVYDPQDIHENLKNPKVIAQYVQDNEGNYNIPSIF
tara:strand:- start:228 stop:746 length:519 start_codon:yes stop_codon:yes gene_type:complete